LILMVYSAAKGGEMKMLHFNYMRKSAGNICLVLFIAFLFSIVVTPVTGVGTAWAGQAEGVASAELVGSEWFETSTGTINGTASGYQLLVNLAVDPLTVTDFNTLKVVFDNGQGSLIQVYARDMELVGHNVYDGVYSNVYSMTYLAPSNFNPTSAAYDVYGKVYMGDNSLFSVILTLNPYPPQGGGSGGGGGSSTPVTPAPTTSTYSDIANHWAKADIEQLAKLGIVKGMSDGKFAPDATITRAQFAAFLIRALGLSESKSSKATYTDVATTAWYFGVVEAANANGLVKGLPNGKFNPNGNISRQEMAVMVSRALKVAGKTTTLTTKEIEEQLAKFNDKGQIANWASESVALAADQEIVNGRTSTTFVPTSNATRAEGVVMIKRVMGNLGKL
jgi:hypothetical protein